MWSAGLTSPCAPLATAPPAEKERRAGPWRAAAQGDRAREGLFWRVGKASVLGEDGTLRGRLGRPREGFLDLHKMLRATSSASRLSTPVTVGPARARPVM
ncbi:hypothetical protein GCM10010358_83190 [Streptomyces minutiscleroticus]|uniref:Uncharacterized protein n=1 Tax=Streptomyces minutiscleroticus TaxID=68238 RepID=A0A918P458_9ACTN|nr:hypothetical protein GCM10010358_83190 [Streptomyces minutiscleroticus]